MGCPYYLLKLRQTLRLSEYAQAAIVTRRLDLYAPLPTRQRRLADAGQASELPASESMALANALHFGWREDAEMTADRLVLEAFSFFVQIIEVAPFAPAHRQPNR